jgi:hypothetical protein
LLGNGRVLVAGGFGGFALSTAEIFDPTAGSWFSAGSFVGGRSRHTATLLGNGKVLITGGDNGAALSTACLYDPTLNSWGSFPAALSVPRRDHTATRLQDGRVLIVGGDSGGGPIASAEIYDPVAGFGTLTGSMNTARAQHTAELLPNGKVLVAGGNDLLGPLSSAEIWDPATGTWTPTTSLTLPRARHTTTVLQTGRVLATGGSAGPTAELYDLNVLDVGAEQTIRVELAPAKPNPFVRSTQMDYALPANGRVRLAVYDVRGRLLTTLVDRELPAGHYSASWDGRISSGGRVHSGMYFARLTVLGGGASQVKLQRLVLVH